MFFSFLVLRIEPRALHALSQQSAIGLQIQPLSNFSLLKQDLSKLSKPVLSFLCSPNKPWTSNPPAATWWVAMMTGRSHQAWVKISFERMCSWIPKLLTWVEELKQQAKKVWVDNNWVNKYINMLYQLGFLSPWKTPERNNLDGRKKLVDSWSKVSVPGQLAQWLLGLREENHGKAKMITWC